MEPFEALKFCPKCGKSDWDNKTNNFRKCRNCGYEMYKNPTIGASALVFDEGGKLLLLRRNKNPAKGTLSLPGGFCEIKESIEEAVMREIFEETGIRIVTEEFLLSRPNDYEYQGIELYPLDFFFRCRIINQDHLKLDTDENSEIVFIHPQEIKLCDIGLKSHKEVLKLLFKLAE